MEYACMTQKKISIIATKGSLDWAYAPFIAATTAHALGFECRIFFTFGGLQLLKKDLDLKMNLVGNPGLPIRVPVLARMLPGVNRIATRRVRRRLEAKGIPSIEALRQQCVEAEIRMFACQMTAEVLGTNPADFIDGVEKGGAATFFDFAGESDICLFI
jgi:peroxiredoxin family protein